MPSNNEKTFNRLKKAAALSSVSLSVCLSLMKTFAALYTGSLAVLSSLIDSLADILASFITLIAVRFSSRPASFSHRYGFGKAEALSSLVQSAFIAGSGIFVMYDGISRMLTPRPVEKTGAGLAIMLISLVLTIALILFQRYVAKKTNSLAILADSAHYTVDVITNIAIIFTLLAVKFFGWEWFDTLAAFCISLYLLANAWKLAKRATGTLMDKELGEDVRQNIAQIVSSCPFAKGMHDLRTRDLGGIYMFELHLELDGNLTLHTAHNYSDIIEDEIRKSYPNAQVIIHQDPAGLKEDRLDAKLKK